MSHEVIDHETGELVPATDVPAVVNGQTDYRLELVLTPEAARGLVDKVREIQQSVMRDGVDYAVIPGTNKPSLLKPGAETLQRVFGLGCTFERTDHEKVQRAGDDHDGSPGRFYGYMATVTRTLPTGQVVTVAQCEGFAGNDEPKWRKAPANTVAKMAQKRAYVGAMLIAAGASDLFTQDLEDMDPDSFASNGGGGGGASGDPFPRGLPFGRSKGKSLAEAATDDLEWLLPKLDPNDPKFGAKNRVQQEAIQAELARRAGDAPTESQQTLTSDDDIPF